MKSFFKEKSLNKLFPTKQKARKYRIISMKNMLVLYIHIHIHTYTIYISHTHVYTQCVCVCIYKN